MPMLKKAANFAPYVGMVFLQTATLPSLLSPLLTGVAQYPPAAMVWMCFAGLCCYMVHALNHFQVMKPYILSNGIGLTCNGALLVAIYTS